MRNLANSFEIIAGRCLILIFSIVAEVQKAEEKCFNLTICTKYLSSGFLDCEDKSGTIQSEEGASVIGNVQCQEHQMVACSIFAPWRIIGNENTTTYSVLSPNKGWFFENSFFWIEGGIKMISSPALIFQEKLSINTTLYNC